MSMGYGANFAYTVTEEQIKRICPKCYKTFLDVLRIENISLEEYAQALVYEEETPKVVDTAYTILADSFEKKTGLCISLDYHGQDNGDIYDDIEGAFWVVDMDNVVQKTKSAKEFEKAFGDIELKHFVTFG